MARPRIAHTYNYMTTSDICRELGISYPELLRRLSDGVYPPPTMVSEYGVRYFDDKWLRIARAIEENSYARSKK